MTTSDSDFAGHASDHLKVVERSIAEIGDAVAGASGAIVQALRAGNKLIAFGNGGSATQASHLAEELIGRFKKTRRPFPAISLTADAGTVTCIANDFGYDALFERQAEALLQAGDIAVGITTSGRSANVLRAFTAAKAQGAITIALTGAGGLESGTVDHLVMVPSSEGAHIQEIHLLVIHVWCMDVDRLLG